MRAGNRTCWLLVVHILSRTKKAPTWWRRRRRVSCHEVKRPSLRFHRRLSLPGDLSGYLLPDKSLAVPFRAAQAWEIQVVERKGDRVPINARDDGRRNEFHEKPPSQIADLTLEVRFRPNRRAKVRL